MEPDRYPCRNPDAAWRVYGGEAVVLSPLDSTLNHLNAVGTLIWQAADGETPLSAIVARICGEFAVEPGLADRDSTAFVEQLRERGLLMLAERPTTGG